MIRKRRSHKSNLANQVKQVKAISKLLDPTGCAKSTKPLIDKIDQELAEIHKQQKQSSEAVKKEYNRLNFPLDSSLNTKPKIPKATKIRILSAEIPEKNERKNAITSNTASRPKKTSSSKVKPSSLKSASFLPANPLPPLLKSTPIHLDPNLKFPKKSKQSWEISKGFMWNSFDSAMNLYSKIQKNDLRNFSLSINAIKSNTVDITNYLDDLVDSIRFSKNEEVMDNMMSTRKYNRKLDKMLKDDYALIQQELNETTTKLMKMGEFKYKKTKHYRYADQL